MALCEQWNWRAANGQLKDMACRSLLLRLERSGAIRQPPRQRKSPNGYRNRTALWVPHASEPIVGALTDLRPLQITCVENASDQARLFRCLLSTYHYLGLRNTVGEIMKYLVHSRDGQPVACLLFGAAAAWTCRARDAWIGWDVSARERNLAYVANNTRFLVLPCKNQVETLRYPRVQDLESTPLLRPFDLKSGSDPSRLAVAPLTGSAGFPAGSTPSRLDAASASCGLIRAHMRGRPPSGAAWVIAQLHRRRSRAGGIEPPTREAG